MPAAAGLTLGSIGASKYWELETTGRFLASEHRDLSVSYVRSHGTRDLNDYDQFFGSFRNPIIRSNENALSATDVPNRLIVRGSIGLPAKLVFMPLYEWRTGFPWSAVNEFQDFVGPRNQSGRLPTVSTPGLHAREALALPQVSLHGAASRSTTPSTPATSATSRTTSPRPTMAGSTIRLSDRSGLSWARLGRSGVQHPRLLAIVSSGAVNCNAVFADHGSAFGGQRDDTTTRRHDVRKITKIGRPRRVTKNAVSHVDGFCPLVARR